MDASTNGPGPGRDLVGSAAELLSTRLEQIDAELAGFEALRAERRRVMTALRTIESAPAKPGPKPPKRRPPGVSQAKLDAVLEVLRATGEPTRMQVVEERLGVSKNTARRALERLREDGLVRVARSERAPGGTRKFYALMPEPEVDRGA